MRDVIARDNFSCLKLASLKRTNGLIDLSNAICNYTKLLQEINIIQIYPLLALYNLTSKIELHS